MSDYSAAAFWETIGLIHDLLNETTNLVRALEEIAREQETAGWDAFTLRAKVRRAMMERSTEAQTLLQMCFLGAGDPAAADQLGIALDRPLH
jgi:hypothetical protein